MIIFLYTLNVGLRFYENLTYDNVTKAKFYVKDFFSIYEQICKKVQISSYLFKKYSTENFMFLCNVITLLAILLVVSQQIRLL